MVSATNITLAGSPDLSARPLTDHVTLYAAKTGTMGAPYSHELVDNNDGTGVDLALAINGSGDLTLTNSSGGTRYFALMIRTTPI